VTVLEPVAVNTDPPWVVFLELDLDKMKVVGWSERGGAKCYINLPCGFHFRTDGTTFIESRFVVEYPPTKTRMLVISENP
jgi:hypothetical protein